MKAHKHVKAHTPPTTFSQIKRECVAEMDRLEPEYFKKHAEQLIPQAFAMFLWTMAVNYGWGKQRLRKLAEALHETDYLMDNPSRMHHRFDAIDLIEVVKDKYGIDVVKEFPPRVEVQK